MSSVIAIVNEAKEAARAAEQAYRAKYGEPMYAGFAWVEVRVERTNSKEAKELIAAGFKKDWKPKVLSLWNPGGSGTQSMDVKEEGAAAFAKVMRQYGYKASACSRAD